MAEHTPDRVGAQSNDLFAIKVKLEILQNIFLGHIQHAEVSVGTDGQPSGKTC
jgi:hypothetical protein